VSDEQEKVGLEPDVQESDEDDVEAHKNAVTKTDPHESDEDDVEAHFKGIGKTSV
jgi:hypothetical protein